MQAVVGELDVGRKGGVDGAVVEVVAHVGEEGSARLELLDQPDGVLEMGVGWVRLATQSVQDEQIEILEERDALFGDGAGVGKVGGGSEAEGADVLAAVQDGDATEAGAEEIDAGPWGLVEAVHLDAGAGGVAIGRIEGIGEDALDGGCGGVVGVEGQSPVGAEAERAQIVHAEDMVGVSVGVEDGINVAQAFANGLRVEVRAGVDEDGAAVVVDADGGAGAAVAWVAGW